MLVYHGSDMEIKTPDAFHSRVNLDFGKGFYTTPLKKQAMKWCDRFVRRGKNGIVSMYEMDEQIFENVKVLKFDSYSEEWLDFILSCRSGKDLSDYEVVIGGVANDKVFNTVELFFEGLIDKNEALKRLRYEEPNLQICLRKQEVIDRFLKFERSERV
ncbi:MAG: DUF3990 domain-containing protein [Lachnospiraceae bacterium]|nr:DUF3990 domain-containing protein [Lachnospiraceae bacterium]